MKIICDCGNECLFDTIDEETGLETEFEDNDEGYGQYARKVGRFDFWSGHDIAGFVCNECQKALWIFT